MHTPRHYKIKIAFLLATLVLLFLSIFSYVKINSLIRTSELINQTEGVKDALEKTFTELLQAETAQRGFILTRNNFFSKEMSDALGKVDTQLNLVDSLTRNIPALQENVNALKAAVNRRILFLENVLADAITSELPETRWLKGKELMSDVRIQIGQMQQEQEMLLRQETAVLDKEAYFTPLISFILISCALLFLVAAYFRLLSELKISDKLRSAVELKQEELESTNQELLHRNEETLSAIARIKQNELALKKQTGQLEDNNKALLRLNKELELFNYISSHDLQEPLRKIQIFASRIQASELGKLSEKGQDDLHRMQDAAYRMQMLIEDLLAYSRTSTSDRNFVKTDLRQITEEIASGYRDEINNRDVEIDIAPMCEANVIPFQFRQLMQNLISNAMKFSKPGRDVQIKVSGEMVDSDSLKAANIDLFRSGSGEAGNGLGRETLYCHISVSDNGIGFEPQYRERIFEIFQRLHTNANYRGTGIGLAIVKKIVENHNGVITATSKPGEGARFDIYLPA